jgi:hypothetical protein
MVGNYTDYIEEAIKLELNVSNLYHLFSMTFPEDKEFWWKLEIEEKNHASLLKSGLSFFEQNLFPQEILPERIEALQSSNLKVKRIAESFNSKWTRIQALDSAIDLENSAGELHYQNFMNSPNNSEIAAIFQKLNGYDKDHSRRILDYKLQLTA